MGMATQRTGCGALRARREITLEGTTLTGGRSTGIRISLEMSRETGPNLLVIVLVIGLHGGIRGVVDRSAL